MCSGYKYEFLEVLKQNVTNRMERKRTEVRYLKNRNNKIG